MKKYGVTFSVEVEFCDEEFAGAVAKVMESEDYTLKEAIENVLINSVFYNSYGELCSYETIDFVEKQRD